MLNGKATIVLLTVGLIKITQYKLVNIFRTKILRKKSEFKIDLDLFNHVTETDLKNAAGIDTSKFNEKDKFPNIDKLLIN